MLPAFGFHMRVLLHYVVGAKLIAEFDYEAGSVAPLPTIGDVVHITFDNDTPFLVKRRLIRHVSKDCVGVLCEVEQLP